MTTFAPTFLDIQNIVIDRLRLDASADLTRVKNAINNASNNVATETKYLSSSNAPAALAAAATSLSIPASIIEVEYITSGYGGQTLILGQLTFDRLLVMRQQPSVAGPPVAYSLRKDTVELWPAAVGGETLTVYGPGLPTALSGDTDLQPYPEPYGSNLLAYGAMCDMAEFTKDILMIGTYQAKYQDWMGRFRAYITRRQGALPKHMIVDDGSHGFYPHDPSSDWDLIGPR